MDFFALVGGHQAAAYRLDLEQSLQANLKGRFQQHADEMLKASLTVVPFERENFQPDESEVLEISPYDLPELIFEPISNPVGWPVLPLDESLLARVYCLFGYDASLDQVIFQVIPRTQRLAGSTFGIILSGSTFEHLKSPGLLLGNACHAVYANSSLRFRSMWWLKQIIDISSYYRAATEADLERLAEMECVKVENVTSLKQKSGQWVRTRVAYILDSGVLEKCSAAELADKAKHFGLALDVIDESGVSKLVIPEEPRQLRSVLKFLEEEYYAGPITGASYEANSKRRI